MATSIRKVKSAERTLDIFEALKASAVPVTASQLADRLGIPKSSLFHLLATLEDRGFLNLEGDGRYAIGPKLIEVAQAGTAQMDIATLIDPILAKLTAAVNETSGFNVERGDNVEVLSTCIGRHALTYTMTTGDLAPLYAVSAGKALLAAKSPEAFTAYLKRVRFEQFTPSTINSEARLIIEVERARQEGVAYVDQEFTPGIVGMAAAVRSQDQIVGAINVVVPGVRANPDLFAKIRQNLFSTVRRAEAALASVNMPAAVSHETKAL